MRKIKFRVWDRDKIIYIVNQGEYQLTFGMYPNWSLWSEEGEVTDSDALRTALMQYTGLKDKQGKEIFEGDVIEERWNNPLSGGEKVERYRVGFTENGLYKMHHSSGEERFHRFLHLRYQQVEVIGNVYEMPDWDF